MSIEIHLPSGFEQVLQDWLWKRVQQVTAEVEAEAVVKLDKRIREEVIASAITIDSFRDQVHQRDILEIHIGSTDAQSQHRAQ
jgi:hypothetical protein